MKPKFKIFLMDEAKEFLSSLDKKTKDKVFYNMRKAQYARDNELLKKISKFVWEFRTKYNRKEIRLLGFSAKDQHGNKLMIITHGFIKKTWKVPKKEIDKTEAIRKKLLNDEKN